MFVTSPAPGRVRHVFFHYFPMIFLGLIFFLIGFAVRPHIGKAPLSILFIILGLVMLIGAILGMLFTTCPKDYVTWRVMCYREPDVRSTREGDYYRELVPDEPAVD